MKRIKLIKWGVFLLALFHSIVLFAQINFRSLTIGDQLADLNLNEIINYKTKDAKISSFRGKLLILDFWATWCSPCIASFPKLDSLRKKYGDKIEIMLIATEGKAVVSKFLDKMSKTRKISLPTITGDEILVKLFPHIYLPHYVWINEKGIVIAITGSSEVNGNNIERVLSGSPISLILKKDLESYVVDTPSEDYTLFAPSIKVRKNDTTKLQNVPISDIKFHSLLTRYNKGLTSGGSFSPDGTGIIITNMTIRNLYRTAFSGSNLQGLNNNSLLIEIPDSTLYNKITTYKRNSAAELRYWLEENGYCYSIKVSPELASKKEEIMLRELNDYFGVLYEIEGKIEKRNAKILAMIRTNNEIAFATKGGAPSSDGDKFSLKFVNGDFKSLISNLALPLQKYPLIVDETGYDGRIDIEINCQVSDLNAVNIELSKYGLQLLEKYKILNIGVIKKIEKPK